MDLTLTLNRGQINAVTRIYFHPSPPAEESGERCKLPQWDPGLSHGRKRFWRISEPEEDISWKQFLSQEQCWCDKMT